MPLYLILHLFSCHFALLLSQTCQCDRLSCIIRVLLHYISIFMNTNSNKPLLLDEMRSILRREGYAYLTGNS